ncbi:hypothetical protein KHC28_01290 [Ancylobacter sonchi]|uniref:hypothetical protein n=1 Tax=Ancylobacter sonchi TaxID=1937790 RepID=UPI001BD4A8FA|nr:hypothetical protein [Ancylobacter sonchi]MBS7532287.1 hypothetical protein [Ancylobacter sonchi]
MAKPHSLSRRTHILLCLVTPFLFISALIALIAIFDLGRLIFYVSLGIVGAIIAFLSLIISIIKSIISVPSVYAQNLHSNPSWAPFHLEVITATVSAIALLYFLSSEYVKLGEQMNKPQPHISGSSDVRVQDLLMERKICFLAQQTAPKLADQICSSPSHNADPSPYR